MTETIFGKNLFDVDFEVFCLVFKLKLLRLHYDTMWKLCVKRQ